MTVRVGLVGAGGIAAKHMQCIGANAQAELAAVCDIVRDRAERAARQYGSRAYSDFGDMIDRERLDALFLCVPPFAHGEMEEQAAERGIHLFVEKPLGLARDEVLRKRAAIGAAGIIAGTGYCLRYQDIVRKMKEYVADKSIAMVRGYYTCGFPEVPWWRVKAKSGGQLVEQTTHIVDLLRYVAGDVKCVYANMALRAMGDIPGLDIPDVGAVNVQFQSGAVGLVETTFIQPDARSGIEVYGRNFRLSLDGSSLTVVEQDRTLIFRSSTDLYREQDDAFIAAVATGRRDLVLAPYDEAWKTLEVTLAANESAATGRPVAL